MLGRCTVELYEYRLLTTGRSKLRRVDVQGRDREQEKEVEGFEKEVNVYVYGKKRERQLLGVWRLPCQDSQ